MLRLDDAERLVMTTHAPDPDMLWRKISLFENVLHGSGEDDDRVDNRKVWMFGCIKADLMHHGIGSNS